MDADFTIADVVRAEFHRASASPSYSDRATLSPTLRNVIIDQAEVMSGAVTPQKLVSFALKHANSLAWGISRSRGVEWARDALLSLPFESPGEEAAADGGGGEEAAADGGGGEEAAADGGGGEEAAAGVKHQRHYLELMLEYLMPLRVGLFRLAPTEGECKHILDGERMGDREAGVSCWSHFHRASVERSREESDFHVYQPRT
jgi:hypothetical protein